MKAQLEAIGFMVELQVLDRATLAQRRDNPDLWDAYSLDWGLPVDPTLYGLLDCIAYSGWTCDPDVARLRHAMQSEMQFERRYRLWQPIQRLVWERVLLIHHGDMFYPRVLRRHVHGPFDTVPAYFWNVWLAQ
jgi:peptide/nickel transport system substrate-binding protein